MHELGVEDVYGEGVSGGFNGLRKRFMRCLVSSLDWSDAAKRRRGELLCELFGV